VILGYRSSSVLIDRLRLSLSPVVVMCLLVIWLTGELSADVGKIQTFPGPGVKNRTGLQVTYDTRWVEGDGYRPIRVTISTTNQGPSPRDRRLLFEIYSGGWTRRQTNLIVSQVVVLPENQTSSTTTILVPQRMESTWGSFDVSEGGRKHKVLSSQQYTGSNNSGWSTTMPCTLVIDLQAPTRSKSFNPANRNSTYDLPDFQWIDPEWNSQRSGSRPKGKTRDSDAIILNLASQSGQLEYVHPSDLDGRWLGLSCFDFIVVSLPELRQIIDQYPEQWQAIRDWAQAGSTLCVYDTGEEFEKIPELEKLLGFSPAEIGERGDKSSGIWRSPGTSGWGRQIDEMPPSSRGQMSELNPNGYPGRAYAQSFPQAQVTANGQPVNPNKQKGKAPTTNLFLQRDWQLGRIVTLGSEEQFPQDAAGRQWFYNSVGAQNWSWDQRHGMSQIQDNSDYWNFLIPGVGLAPITLFQVLITFFVIVIGPVNFIVLKRWGRLAWLLATVPVGAAIVTFSLFGYALVADGLGVQSRIRSFTYIDQANEHAVTWARQSYYAGLVPSGGLSFPGDTAIFPLYPNPPYPNQSNMRRTINWDDDQVFRSGFMKSRVTSQFMTIRSAQSTAMLSVDDSSTEADIISGHNQLGVAIRQLLVCDDDGAYYWASDVGGDQPFEAKSIVPSEARESLRTAIGDAKLKVPEEFDHAAVRNLSTRRSMFNYRYMNGQETPPDSGSSLLERQISILQDVERVPLEPRTYVALTEQTPDVGLGYSKAVQVDCFHVIVGKW